jgi:cobalt-precorrin-5B (C1)-methyltransferase
MPESRRKRLKSGYTTGTAAAAAVKGALTLLVKGTAPERVRIPFLSEGYADIGIHTCRLEKGGRTVVSTVIKDAGDDPDVTNKAEIGARVAYAGSQAPGHILITGGTGVGVVTKPGLEVPPGNPAINPGPIRMIKNAVADVFKGEEKHLALEIEIFVPEGERLAEKTLNKRLGILGGISILGTTGIVRPMSHAAYIATITSALSVARAAGQDTVVFTTGRRSERFSQAVFDTLPEEAFIQIGDFFEKSLRSAVAGGMKDIVLAVFFGKAVKMAQGIPHTHASKARLTLDKLSQWALRISGDEPFSRKIAIANTARHAFDIILEGDPAVIADVGKRMVAAARKFANSELGVRGVIFNYDGNIVFDSEKG